MRVIGAAQGRAYVMISPTANGSAAAECIVWVRVWAYGCTKASQRCAFEGGAGRGSGAATAAAEAAAAAAAVRAAPAAREAAASME